MPPKRTCLQRFSVILHALCDLHEQTFRKWAWLYVKELAKLQIVCQIYSFFISNKLQIKLRNRLFARPSTINCWISVDGTDFLIKEPSPFDSSYYSHKFKHADLRYKVCVDSDGNIVWTNGPFPCGEWSDLKIFQLNLRNELGYFEKVVADNGYKDPKCLTPNKLTEECKRLGSLIRARHESLNGRFKNFSVLRQMFRHSRLLHAYCFHAVANATQIMLQTDPLFCIQ